MTEEIKNKIIIPSSIDKERKNIFPLAVGILFLALVVAFGLVFLLAFIPNRDLSLFLERASEGVEKSVKVLPACSLPYPVFETEFTDQDGQKLLVGWGKITRFEKRDTGTVLVWIGKPFGRESALEVENNSVTVNFNNEYSRYFIFGGGGFRASKITSPFSSKLTGTINLSLLSVGDCLKYYLEPQISENNKVTLGKLVRVDFLGVGEFIY